MSFIETLYEEFLSLGEKPETIIGCTTSEIDELKQIQGISSLPALYEEFLAKMGRGAGEYFVGSSIFYGAMKYFNFKEEAKNLLSEMNASFELPEKAFVFLWHQGYTFFYFDTQANDTDPVIYRYQEGYKEPVEAGHLSELLLAEMNLHKKMFGYNPD